MLSGVSEVLDPNRKAGVVSPVTGFDPNRKAGLLSVFSAGFDPNRNAGLLSPVSAGFEPFVPNRIEGLFSESSFGLAENRNAGLPVLSAVLFPNRKAGLLSVTSGLDPNRNAGLFSVVSGLDPNRKAGLFSVVAGLDPNRKAGLFSVVSGLDPNRKAGFSPTGLLSAVSADLTPNRKAGFGALSEVNALELFPKLNFPDVLSFDFSDLSSRSFRLFLLSEDEPKEKPVCLLSAPCDFAAPTLKTGSAIVLLNVKVGPLISMSESESESLEGFFAALGPKEKGDFLTVGFSDKVKVGPLMTTGFFSSSLSSPSLSDELFDFLF